MADNNVFFAKQINSSLHNMEINANHINGLIHENKDSVNKIWGENGKHYKNGHQIKPKMLNGFYKHKTGSSESIKSTSLRSSPTRNKVNPVVNSESVQQQVVEENRLKDEVKIKDEIMIKTEVKNKEIKIQDEIKDGGIKCKWMDCGHVAINIIQLADHAREQHIDPMKCCDVFVCLWQDCKVFNRPSCSLTWLTKHLESHIGVKPFKCVIDGCSLSFCSQTSLARHVHCHFEDDFKTIKKPVNKEESPSRKHLKRKRLKYIWYKKASGKNEDFVDQHAVDSIKTRLSNMIVTDTDYVGIDGTIIHFKSQALGRRVDDKGLTEVLLHWIPESILPDEWISSDEVNNYLHCSIPIQSLPNHIKADLHPSFYRRLSHRKQRRK